MTMSKIKLPWNGVVKIGCKEIKYNGGLYTQCGGKTEEELCGRCNELIKKNGGVSNGSVNDRMSCGVMEYKDPKGRSPVSYSKIMKKNGWSMEDVEKEGLRLGEKILECHFEEVVVKRGRPRKEKVEVEKKKRGRPRKEKEVVSNIAGEALIASLLDGSNHIDKRMGEIKETEIESEGEIKETEIKEGETKETEIESEGEETQVVKCELNGKIYLRSEDNWLFDIESHDAIGVWNENEGRIDEMEDEY